MMYKKTWLSCLLWAVFTCITGVLLADYTISIWIREIDPAVGTGTVILIAVVFALAVGVCFLFRKIYNKAENKYKANTRRIIIFENLLFFIIFAAGLLYRIDLCLHCSADMITGGQYFELAAVTAGKTSEIMIKNMSDLYTVCLSFVLSFLGNKLIVGVWMQIFVQMLTICLCFWTFRKLTGKIPAYAAILFLAFSPVYTGQIFTMTPEVLSFFLFVLALFIIGNYVKNYSLDVYGVRNLIFLTLLCGCIIGALVYLDAFFLTLLVIPAGLPGVICSEKEEEIIPSKVLPVFLFVLMVSAAGLVLMGLFALEAYTLEDTIAVSARSWISAYTHLPVYVPYITKTSVAECFILAFLSALLIMSFWFRPKVQNVAPWIVLMLLFGPPHMTPEVPGYRIYSFFIWSILAGIGLQQCFTLKKSDVRAAKAEPVNEQIPESVTVSEVKTEPMEDDMKTIPTEEKPRFIENPLPLPKKHEKRSMDYQYEVDESKLEFDIEIAENDDFDV